METGDGERFFDEKLCNPRESFRDLTVEAFELLMQFFILINEEKGFIEVTRVQEPKNLCYGNFSNLSNIQQRYSFNKKKEKEREREQPEMRVRTHPEKLKGVEILWRIIQEADIKPVTEKARDFLSKLYTKLAEELEPHASLIRNYFIETYLERLNGLLVSSQLQTIERMITLMMDMIDESERKGTGRLKSHCALLKGPLIVFTVSNEITTGKSVPKEMEVSVHANTSIWELKAELGKYVESSAECMKMTIGGKEMQDTDNGKIINDFVSKKRGYIKLEKKNMDDVPKAALITEEGILTERAHKAFTAIFNKFAKDGKMDDEATALFTQNTTKESFVQKSDTRVRMILANFGKANGSYLELDGFLDFYRDALATRKDDLVRQNLLAHGYRNDLKNISEIEEAEVDISSLPRYILSSNPRSFELLFRVLDMGDSKVGEQVWNLISRLTTNEGIYGKLLELKDGVAWEELVCVKSKYRLLYALQIIESFLEDEVLEKKEWRKKFIEKGGSHVLLSLIHISEPTRPY
eukprot:TRINITY_DN14319_c0_g1_i18.p1 TRINITY_DN14319_c0_g1~~TRINITY_DN14319_c0_g1_i18.p1  ORF type:complete len:524 (-),score=194.29 TRINITY_DN14319_c0_g1_i18:66-1637(-)